MIVYLLLKIMVFLFNFIIWLLSSIFPISLLDLGINDKIDDFYNLFDSYASFALNGAHFLLGDFVLGLAGTALLLYTFYYTIYIPIKFVFKIFVK